MHLTQMSDVLLHIYVRMHSSNTDIELLLTVNCIKKTKMKKKEAGNGVI